MRELIYAVEGKAANLKTFAVDEPGHGGACHKYIVVEEDYPHVAPEATINFQNGPIDEDGNGVNGIQNEDLLAILIDRLEGFQKGPYKCDEHAAALRNCKIALYCLNERTKKRNVEGTHAV